MPVSPKYETTIPLLTDESSSRSFLPTVTRSTVLCRRSRRVPVLISFPIALAVIYIILTYSESWIGRTTSFITPIPYLSHAGRGALESTIILPRIQYHFDKGDGGDPSRRTKIQETIRRTWELYTNEAWGWDEVKPTEGGGRDTRYSPFSQMGSC